MCKLNFGVQNLKMMTDVFLFVLLGQMQRRLHGTLISNWANVQEETKKNLNDIRERSTNIYEKYRCVKIWGNIKYVINYRRLMGRIRLIENL